MYKNKQTDPLASHPTGSSRKVNHTTRRFSSLLLYVACLCILAGCSKDNDADPKIPEQLVGTWRQTADKFFNCDPTHPGENKVRDLNCSPSCYEITLNSDGTFRDSDDEKGTVKVNGDMLEIRYDGDPEILSFSWLLSGNKVELTTIDGRTITTGDPDGGTTTTTCDDIDIYTKVE